MSQRPTCSRGSLRPLQAPDCRYHAARRGRAPPASSSCSRSSFPRSVRRVEAVWPLPPCRLLLFLGQGEAFVALGGDLVALPAVSADTFRPEIRQERAWLARDVGSHVPGI